MFRHVLHLDYCSTFCIWHMPRTHPSKKHENTPQYQHVSNLVETQPPVSSVPPVQVSPRFTLYYSRETYLDQHGGDGLGKNETKVMKGVTPNSRTPRRLNIPTPHPAMHSSFISAYINFLLPSFGLPPPSSPTNHPHPASSPAELIPVGVSLHSIRFVKWVSTRT